MSLKVMWDSHESGFIEPQVAKIGLVRRYPLNSAYIDTHYLLNNSMLLFSP